MAVLLLLLSHCFCSKYFHFFVSIYKELLYLFTGSTWETFSAYFVALDNFWMLHINRFYIKNVSVCKDFSC